MDDNWIYYGVFLDQASRQALLEEVKRYVEIPEDWRIYCDHMTIVHRSNPQAETWKKIAEAKLNQKTALLVHALGRSEGAIAVMVNGQTANEIPHITVACAPGVKPVASNNITNWEEIEPFEVRGKVGVVCNKKAEI